MVDLYESVAAEAVAAGWLVCDECGDEFLPGDGDDVCVCEWCVVAARCAA